MLLCDRVLGNINDDPAAADGLPLDPVTLTWDECDRRALRRTTRGGRRLTILLPPGAVLQHGDVLARDEAGVIVVDVQPVEVLVVRPRTAMQAAIAALELGNLHVPTEATEHELIALADGPAEAALTRHGIAFTAERRRFSPLPAIGRPRPQLGVECAVRLVRSTGTGMPVQTA